MRLIFLLIVLTLVACQVSNKSVEEIPAKERCELLMKFTSLEDMKRIPYQLSNLKFELKDAISTEERIYLIELDCYSSRETELIQKLSKQLGVEWVRPVAEN